MEHGWRSQRRTRAAVAVAFAALAVACSQPATPADTAGASGTGVPSTAQPPTPADQPAQLEPSEPYGITTVSLVSPDGQTTVPVEVYDAYWPATRQKGLMGRDHLPAGTGMVFRYPDDHNGGFWMKNTLIPLSIAYFAADGTVVSVLDMEPCVADPCPGYPPNRSYRHALEVNQGFFAEIGLTEGWRVELPSGLPAAQA